MNASRAVNKLGVLIVAIAMVGATCAHAQAQQLNAGGPAPGERPEFAGERAEPERPLPSQSKSQGGFFGELRRKGLDVVLVIPRSGRSLAKLKEVKFKTTQLVTAIHRLVPIAQVGIVSYSGNSDKLATVDLTDSMPGLVKSLAALKMHSEPPASTDAAAALRAAVTTMNWHEYAKHIIVLFAEMAGGPEAVADMIELARKFHAANGTINTVDIAPISEQKTPVGKATVDALRRIATAGGGKLGPFTKPAAKTVSDRDDTG